MYKESAGIINRELSRFPVSLSEGKRKKYFASAITPKGTVNHIPELIRGYGKVYCFMAPAGFRTDGMLRTISENSVHRGFMVEEFYCPMIPGEKLEHLLIPQLGMAFITLNNYHDIDADCCSEVTCMEMRDYIDWNKIEPYSEVLDFFTKESEIMIERAVGCLKQAKAEHDVLESFYVPNMNFQKIKDVKDGIIGKIERNIL